MKFVRFVKAGTLIKITPQMRKFMRPPTKREKSLWKMIQELEEKNNRKKFEDCAYKTKEEYCKPEDCETCKGVTEESIADFDMFLKKQKEEANSW